MDFTKFLILIFISGAVLADEKSCFSDTRISNDGRVVFKEAVSSEFFLQLDNKLLFDKLILEYSKKIIPKKTCMTILYSKESALDMTYYMPSKLYH